MDYKSRADQSPQGLIASVEKTTSISVESTGAIKSAAAWIGHAEGEIVVANGENAQVAKCDFSAPRK